MHHIRRSVLGKLATAEYMRYSDIKPGELDGNIFNYHLKGLMADKFVLKDIAGLYSLTQQGRDYIVRRHESSIDSAHSIFLIVLQRSSKFLLRQRRVQPLLGYTGFIHGEPEAGIEVLNTASKRLHDKTGLQNVDLSIVGSALLAQYKHGELQSYSHAIVLYGQTDQDITVFEDTTGHNYWSELSTADKLLPSCNDIVSMIDTGLVWLERSYDLY